MTGLQPLIRLIYHEKQEPGSMLCAQHALNTILQGRYFSAPDLGTIAQELDRQEATHHPEQATNESSNMDDTGFFSVQVLEGALGAFGLRLARWRGEEMRQYHDSPHTQLAYILNHREHWFTIRRFGRLSTDLRAEDGPCHWFNLNSILGAPEWVGKLYLQMVLHQAEEEGYTVFAVLPGNPNAPLTFPRTEADDVAATLPEPTNSREAGSQFPLGARFAVPSRSRTPDSPSSTAANLPGRGGEGEDWMADEDLELQAALQASLRNGTTDELLVPDDHAGFTRHFAPSVRPMRAGMSQPIQARVEDDEELDTDDGEYMPPGMFRADNPQAPRPQEQDESDPVAASQARNQAALQRMLREQQAAFATDFGVQDETQLRRRREIEEEEEMIRRAIEESRSLHEGSDPETPAASRAENAPPAQSMRNPQHRVYDDEDAELQAALKASMEELPDDFQIPDTPPRAAPSRPLPSSSSSMLPEGITPMLPGLKRLPSSKSLEGSEATYDTESEADMEVEAAPVQPAEMSIEEIRRQRLARFGAPPGAA